MTKTEMLFAAITILAILVGPFLGVWTQKRLESHRTKRERRDQIFKVLMATRQARVSADHVHALNRIDLDFKGVEAVQEAWHEYRDHLNYPVPLQELTQADQAAWYSRGNELFSNLLHALSTSLGYGFDRKYLANTAYRPQAYLWEEQFQQGLRLGVAQLLTGRYALPIQVVAGAPQAEEDMADEPEGPSPSGSSGAEGQRDPSS